MRNIIRILVGLAFAALAQHCFAQDEWDDTMGGVSISPNGQTGMPGYTQADYDHYMATGSFNDPSDPNAFQVVIGTAADAAEHTAVETVIEGSFELLLEELADNEDPSNNWCGADDPPAGMDAEC